MGCTSSQQALKAETVQKNQDLQRTHPPSPCSPSNPPAHCRSRRRQPGRDQRSEEGQERQERQKGEEERQSNNLDKSQQDQKKGKPIEVDYIEEEKGGEYDSDIEREIIFTNARDKWRQSKNQSKRQKQVKSKLVDFDKELEDFFEVDDVTHGDEFGAVKPWKGAIVEPKNAPPAIKEKPEFTYDMDFVYGIRTDGVRMNLYYNRKRQPVYMAAAIGIILNPSIQSRGQIYFGGGETSLMKRKQGDESLATHTDDITALAMSLDRTTVATGQNGLQPLVYLWDAVNAMPLAMFKLPKGTRSVSALAFSRTGEYLAVCDMHNDHNVYVYQFAPDPKSNMRKATLVAGFPQKGGQEKIFHCSWSRAGEEFTTVGPKHIKVWGLTGRPKNGVFGGNSKMTSFSCVTYDEKGQSYTGALNGMIYKWNGGSLMNTYPFHKGCINCINYIQEADGTRMLLSGGVDNTIQIINPDDMTSLQAIQVETAPKSLDFSRYLLVGLKNGSISEFDLKNDKKEVIMHSHHDGEVWGLCVVPQRNRFITSGDDNKILLYDIASKKCVGRGLVKVEDPMASSSIQRTETMKANVQKYQGGASSMSSLPADKQSRALAYEPWAKHLAVATNTGLVTIREVTLEIGCNLNNVIYTLKDAKEWIECMSYSPDGDKLAVGSHDNNIYIYLTKQQYQKSVALRGHNSFITSLDWSASSEPSYIRSNCGAYELLFFNVDNKRQDASGASNTTEYVWQTSSVKFGYHVQGIFPAGCDGSHINTVDMSDDQAVIATGDDFGLVNVYRNPCLEGVMARSFRGHSEHVTNVKFANDKYLISVGGQDQTIIQWKKNVEPRF